jgi:hypothetical protein
MSEIDALHYGTVLSTQMQTTRRAPQSHPSRLSISGPRSMQGHIKTITQSSKKRFICAVALLLCYEGERELRREGSPSDSLGVFQGYSLPATIG